MRKLLILLAAVLLTATVGAQAPQKMSYQAVIRNAGNTLVTNAQVGMQISILQGSPTGTVVYTEIQTPTTNSNGLVTIEIGGGAGFNTIDWANGIYFIKTETDPAGGTSYTITGTSQLLSVPFAIHANTAETLTGSITETDPVFEASSAFGISGTDITSWNNKLDSEVDGSVTNEIQTLSITDGTVYLTDGGFVVLPVGFDGQYSSLTGAPANVSAFTNDAGYLTSVDGSETKITAGANITVTGAGTSESPYVVASTGGTHYLGEEYLDGIIFYLYTGSAGEQKGLVVSKTESTAIWSGSALVGANSTSNGVFNTSLLPTGAGTARAWAESLGSGWYVPSVDELIILWHNRFHVNNSNAIGLTLLPASAATTSYYWSSTEYDGISALLFGFYDGMPRGINKNSTYNVRAVRAF